MFDKRDDPLFANTTVALFTRRWCLFFPDEAVQKVRGAFVHLEHATMQRGFVHIVRNHEELEVDVSRAQKRNEPDRLRGIQIPVVITLPQKDR